MRIRILFLRMHIIMTSWVRFKWKKSRSWGGWTDLELPTPRQLPLAMNEQRRRASYNETRGQQSSQYIGVIALVFCAFLVWLWLYSPGSTDDATAPSFASAEVRDWLDNNQLQELRKDPKFIGKTGRYKETTLNKKFVFY